MNMWFSWILAEFYEKHEIDWANLMHLQAKKSFSTFMGTKTNAYKWPNFDHTKQNLQAWWPKSILKKLCSYEIQVYIIYLITLQFNRNWSKLFDKSIKKIKLNILCRWCVRTRKFCELVIIYSTLWIFSSKVILNNSFACK